MNNADRRDWILPGIVLVLLFVGFGLLRLVDFGPPDDWSAEDGPFPFKRMEAELERMKAARTRPTEAAPPTVEWALQGGPTLAWSRDGALLAGARSGDAPAIARLEGGEVEVLAIPGLGSPEHGYAWHPQGMLLVCGRVGEGAASRLHTTAWTRRGAVAPVDMLDDGEVPGDLRHPALSPDGSRVALVAAEGESARLVVWDRGSGEVHALAEAEDLAHPTWSPDGSEVAIAARSEGQWDVVAVPAEGGERRVVAGGPGDQHLPAWAADGTLVWSDERILRSEPPGDLDLEYLVAHQGEMPPAVAGGWIAVVAFETISVFRLHGEERSVFKGGSQPRAVALVERPGGLRLAWTDPAGTLRIRDIPVEP